MATARRAVELARTLRATAGLRVRQPIARMWIALPGGALTDQAALLQLVSDDLNVKHVEVIGDESELLDRRVKPLLPKIGKRVGRLRDQAAGDTGWLIQDERRHRAGKARPRKGRHPSAGSRGRTPGARCSPNRDRLAIGSEVNGAARRPLWAAFVGLAVAVIT